MSSEIQTLSFKTNDSLETIPYLHCKPSKRRNRWYYTRGSRSLSQLRSSACSSRRPEGRTRWTRWRSSPIRWRCWSVGVSTNARRRRELWRLQMYPVACCCDTPKGRLKNRSSGKKRHCDVLSRDVFITAKIEMKNRKKAYFFKQCLIYIWWSFKKDNFDEKFNCSNETTHT